MDNTADIARKEIFGPVVVIVPYDDEDDAVAIANDTGYGFGAYVQSRDQAHARRVAAALRAGRVYVNYRESDEFTPFGGNKQSGNGRDGGVWAIKSGSEIKASIGYNNGQLRSAYLVPEYIRCRAR